MYPRCVAVCESRRQERPDLASGQPMQNLKPKGQTALDNGPWEVSWHLTGPQDRAGRPLSTEPRRGMAAVASSRTAVKELKRKSQGDRPRPSSGYEICDHPPREVRDRREGPKARKHADAGVVAA